jgi:SAM-dependent methyltransferase
VGAELPVDFADPWEHIRLLSDRARNDALLTMLARRAPGARVLEVGCGTGLLSCVAAQLGATRVTAVEVTELADRAKELVAASGLQDKVEVIRGRMEDLEPRPVDLAFSELLNADPLFEGVLPAMDAAVKWVVPGGRWSPTRVRIYVALAWVEEPALEFTRATEEVRRICAAYGLRPEPWLSTLDVWHPHRFTTNAERPVSSGVCALDLPIGQGEPAPQETLVWVTSTVDGAVGGALVWFSAEVDDDVWMTNPPGAGSHWGQMVCGWTRPLTVRRGQRVALRLRRVGSEILVVPEPE